MSKPSGAPPPVCKVPGCGRKIRVRALCQTHYNQMRETGTVRPIAPQRPRRLQAVKLSGLSVTPDCKEKLMRRAEERDLAINAVVTDILEAWAKVYWARKKTRSKPST